MVTATLLAAASLCSQAQFQQFGEIPDTSKRIQKPLSVLVFSKTAGFRHDSIPNAHEAIQGICNAQKWTAAHTEDSAQFTTENLTKFDVVVFASTTGDVLNADQQGAFEGFIRKGGGYVGIHAASDTEYEWPWYGRLVGAWFKTHPAIQQASVKVDDAKHPCSKMFPNPWKRTDEWYTFRANPREDVHVLASLDETTYQGGGMGDHPIVWCHEFEGGRALYNGMGHVKETFTDPVFLKSLTESLRWAAGKSKRR